MNFCFWVASKAEGCGSHCWALLNDALYCVTHPSLPSNVGPTASIVSRYVDVVPFGLCVVKPETDVRTLVVVANSQKDLFSLIKVCIGNGSLSVHDNVLHQQTVNVLLSRITNKMQLVIEFIIPEFIEGIERLTAHHQDL